MAGWRHIFFIADIEGVAGVDSWDQTRRAGPRHERAKALATAEVNSVIQALLGSPEKPNAGAPRISVWDGHGYGGLLLDHIDGRVASYPHLRARAYPELLRDSLAGPCPVDAIGFIGQHAMEASGGTLSHTYSSRRVRRYCLNGLPVGEFGVRAMYAWALAKIPAVFISGDDVACREARSIVPGIIQVAVKKSLGITAARHLDHLDSCALLSSEAARILDIDPFDPSLRPVVDCAPPYEFRKEFKRRFGVLPRARQVLRGEDLAEILARE
jgi:D-amino peptidase